MCLVAGALPAAAMNRAVGMAAVKQQLSDPSSAMFRNVRFFEVAICGEVNSKDASGAYTGYTRFIVSGSSAAPMVWIENQSPSDFRLSWNRACHAAK
jgi:hypothetical protein